MKADFEKPLIFLFFALLLWMSYANLSEHKISHDFPYGYLASDAFQHQVRAENVREQGHYKTELPSMVLGFKDIIGFYQPITSQLAALTSAVSGLEAYDTLILMTAVLMSMMPLIVYFIIRHFSRNAAILSLPLMVLLFTKKFYMGFLFGQWPFLTGSFFLICSAWAITKLEMKKSWALLAIFLSATLMSHAAELIFIAGFLAAIFAIKLAKNELTKREFSNITTGTALFAIITSYQWLILKNSWFVYLPYKFSIETTTGGAFPDVFLKEFGLLLIPIAIGAIFAIIILLKKRSVPILFAFYMTIVCYTNYIGFGSRAFQTRFIWPAYIAIFFGLGAYQLLKLAVKNWKEAYSITVSIILIVSFAKAYYTNNQPAQGIMDNYHWEMFGWLKNNAEQDSNALFLYGNTYRQTAILWNSGLVNYYVNLEDYTSELKHSYLVSAAEDADVGLIYKTGALSFADHVKEINNSIRRYEANICKFNYYVMDKYGDNTLVQRNSEIKEKLTQEGMKVIFENPTTIVIKNDERKDCRW